MAREYETFEGVGFQGRRFVVDLAFRLGDMGVTRSAIDDGWCITHLPTSYRMPCVFSSDVVAEECLKELDKIADWPGFMESLAAGKKPNCLEEVKRILVDHGARDNTARDAFTPEQSAAEFRGRLDATKTSAKGDSQ